LRSNLKYATKAGSSMRHPLLPLTLIAALPVLGGCGSGTPSTKAAAAPNVYRKAVQFAECMRTHGVSGFPDPVRAGHGGFGVQISAKGGGPISLSEPAMKSAQRACVHLLPNAGKPSGTMSPAQRRAFLANAQCMRTHGVPNFPDPQFSGGGVEVRLGGGLDPSSPAFQAAQKACQKLLPFAKFGSGPVTAAAKAGG
jgi:hypothetical protein